MLDPLAAQLCRHRRQRQFTRAGERVHLTQSTISQQMRRLEQQLGCPLLDRSGRQVVTTAEGKLLGLARSILALLARAEEQVAEASLQLSLGVPEDFAAGAIAPVLAALPAITRRCGWRCTAASATDLAALRGWRAGSGAGQTGAGTGAPRACWREPLAWVDSRAWPASERDPLPLVVFPSEGLYRRQVTEALDGMGRRWRIAYVSASLASLQGR